MRNSAVYRGRFVTFPALALTVAIAAAPTLPVAAAEAGNKATGVLRFKTATVTLKYAYFVKGPDAVDANQIIRRLILSSTDIEAKLQACTTMSCADGALKEGMEVDFGSGRRLNYWPAVNNQLQQYSGTAMPEAFTAQVNDANRIAGKLSIDDTAAGGPRVDVEVDAAFFKEFKAAR
jgi:hypothetical protein